MAMLLRYRECDACGEVYSDNGVDLIHTAAFIEDGPEETAKIIIWIINQSITTSLT
jgi:hypothetical protein